MDVSVASYYIIEKNGNKSNQMGHTKKIDIKNYYQVLGSHFDKK